MSEQDWANLTKEAYYNICYPKPKQKWHIHTADVYFLYELLHKEKPKIILEIGAAYGTSSKLFAGFLKGQGEGKLYSIEPSPKQEWYDNMNEYNLLTTAELIPKASPWVNWEGMPEIDFLFIDGWHNFRNVFVDYFYWQKYVKMDGLIVFHDTELHTSVNRAINEIHKTEILELVGKEYDGTVGLEVYRKVKDKRGSVAFFGPWVGEMGWEIVWWQGFCRKESRKYDYSIISTYPGHEGLYEDFANEIIPHKLRGQPLCGHLNNSTGEFNYPTVNKVYAPPISEMIPNDQQEFIKFGHSNPNTKFDVLVHMNERSTCNDWRFYPHWIELITALLKEGHKLACFGKNDVGEHYRYGSDGWDERTTDIRNITLKELMQYMAGCRVVIGPASGIMHLASYCGSNIVVWCDDTKWTFDQSLRERYEVIMNPHKTPVTVIDQYSNWQPPVQVVVDEVEKFIKN